MTTTTIESPQQTADEPLLVTVDEAARRLSISPRLVYIMLDAGDLKSVKLRGARRVVVASLHAYIEKAQQ